MHRLLEGEVGSGKTVVALYAALVAIQSGHQATIMAPTEVLAGQHLRNVDLLLSSIGGRRITGRTPGEGVGPQPGLFDNASGGGPRYALLTAAVTGKERERIVAGVASGEVDLLVGTHALLEEKVAFAALGVVVIDEQHRFGVEQRAALRGKGDDPDVLVMTATPIPARRP